MEICQAHFQLNSGVSAQQINVTVYDFGTNNPATIFNALTLTPIGATIQTDVNGNIMFAAADGKYEIRSTNPGVTVTYYVELLDSDLDGIARLGTAQSFTKAQSVTPIAVASSGVIAPDASLSNNFRIALAHNATLDNPTNLANGEVINTKITQAAGGGWTLAYGTKWKFVGSTPVLAPALGAESLLCGIYWADSDTILANLSGPYV